MTDTITRVLGKYAFEGFALILTKRMTMMSVMKSDRECTASAIIAELCPTIPAMNLNVSNAMLPALPTNVTL